MDDNDKIMDKIIDKLIEKLSTNTDDLFIDLLATKIAEKLKASSKPIKLSPPKPSKNDYIDDFVNKYIFDKRYDMIFNGITSEELYNHYLIFLSENNYKNEINNIILIKRINKNYKSLFTHKKVKTINKIFFNDTYFIKEEKAENLPNQINDERIIEPEIINIPMPVNYQELFELKNKNNDKQPSWMDTTDEEDETEEIAVPKKSQKIVKLPNKNKRPSYINDTTDDENENNEINDDNYGTLWFKNIISVIN